MQQDLFGESPVSKAKTKTVSTKNKIAVKLTELNASKDALNSIYKDFGKYIREERGNKV